MYVINKIDVINRYHKKTITENLQLENPIFIFKQENGTNYYIVKLTYLWQRGRRVNVYHVLVLNEVDYYDYINLPVRLFNYSEENFKHSKPNRMGVLQNLDSLYLEEYKLNFNDIINRYNLNNVNFSEFMSALYYSLLFDKKMIFGLYIDNFKDREIIFKELNYIILSLLPYGLREKVTFSNVRAPIGSNIYLQFIGKDDEANGVDFVYDIDRRSIEKNTKEEYLELHLERLFEKTEDSLKKFFDNAKVFIDDIALKENNKESKYILLKCSMINNDINIFKYETVNEQLTLINRILALLVTNKKSMQSFVLKLLQNIKDKDRYYEKFIICYRLYCEFDKGLNNNKPLLSNVTINNFKNCTVKEKSHAIKKIYQDSMFDSELFSRCIQECNDNELKVLYPEIILIYDRTINDFLCKIVIEKYCDIFKTQDNQTRIEMFDLALENITNKQKRNKLIYCYIIDDYGYLRMIIERLMSLYEESLSYNYGKLINLLEKVIYKVINQSEDSFIIEKMNSWIWKYKGEEFDRLYVHCINCIRDYSLLKNSQIFIEWIQERYYVTKNGELKDIYYELVLEFNKNQLEKIIDDIYIESVRGILSSNTEQLMDKVSKIVFNKKIELTTETLIKFLKIIYYYYDNLEICNYLREVYLTKKPEDVELVYKHL